ncbi:hypothetical protein HK102_013112, partial [Quaeritorhiza haematococci]
SAHLDPGRDEEELFLDMDQGGGEGVRSNLRRWDVGEMQVDIVVGSGDEEGEEDDHDERPRGIEDPQPGGSNAVDKRGEDTLDLNRDRIWRRSDLEGHHHPASPALIQEIRPARPTIGRARIHGDGNEHEREHEGILEGFLTPRSGPLNLGHEFPERSRESEDHGSRGQSLMYLR